MPEPEMPKKLGRYEIVGELGKGAMGIVYEGVDPNIGRRVAIKTARRDVLEQSGRGPEMMERFLREARAAGVLNHPNLVTIYDADEQDGIAFIAMEHLEGTELRRVIAEKRRFDPVQVVEWTATLCEALAHAHEHGVIHRDIKPPNIIVLPDDTLKIADFGIAHVDDSELTREGSMIGTPFYMSPEQFMGQKIDGRADLFSVGVIAYELLTGEKPFQGEAVSTVMHNVLHSDPVPPRKLNFAVNENLNQVIEKALSKDPNRRYQDGLAMARALRETLKDEPDPAVLDLSSAGVGDANEATTIAGPDEETTFLKRHPTTEPERPATVRRREPLAATAAMPVEASPVVPPRRRRTFLIAGAALLVACLLGAGVFLLRPEPENSWGSAEIKLQTQIIRGDEISDVPVEAYVKIYDLAPDSSDEPIWKGIVPKGGSTCDFSRPVAKFKVLLEDDRYEGESAPARWTRKNPVLPMARCPSMLQRATPNDEGTSP